MSFIREHFVKPLTRSKGWRTVRKEHLIKHPYCEACGRTKKLEVHHIRDFSNYPALELDYSNLITLCDGSTHCHFVFGHLGNWKSINLEIQKDSDWFHDKIVTRRGR